MTNTTVFSRLFFYAAAAAAVAGAAAPHARGIVTAAAPHKASTPTPDLRARLQDRTGERLLGSS